MNKKSSPIARISALLALAAAIVGVFVVVTGSTGSEDSGKMKNQPGKQAKQAKKKTPKTYEVQPDDTLTGIAQQNGVSVERIEALNPDLDPQALQAGQKLKLR